MVEPQPLLRSVQPFNQFLLQFGTGGGRTAFSGRTGTAGTIPESVAARSLWTTAKAAGHRRLRLAAGKPAEGVRVALPGGLRSGRRSAHDRRGDRGIPVLRDALARRRRVPAHRPALPA